MERVLKGKKPTGEFTGKSESSDPQEAPPKEATDLESPAPPADIDREVVIAIGNMCLGLGEAIKGLAKLGLASDAQELAVQLKFTSKNLGWMLRNVTNRHSPSLESNRTSAYIKPGGGSGGGSGNGTAGGNPPY